jgi:hypothetical protein
MLTDARIRLEGQLEEVERAAAVLELALPPARLGSWTRVKIALDTVGVPQVWRAVRATREMAKTEPELAPVLRRLDATRIAIADAVHAAARKRAFAPGTVGQELDRLAADEVLYEAQLRNPRSTVVVPILFFLVAVSIAASHSPGAAVGVLAVALLISFGLVPFLFSTHVLLTRQALIIGGRSVRTADVRRVELRVAETRGATPYLIRVELKGNALVDRLPDAPLELDAALLKVGIETERIGSLWF